jgi:hypothetical protein
MLTSFPLSALRLSVSNWKEKPRETAGTNRGLVYRFALVAKGDASRQVAVTIDLALFRAHGVGIQESLTAEDLRPYAQEPAGA